MKIYIGHSTSFDFKKELYEPLRNSELNKLHEITLPHENSDKQFNSKQYLKSCDLMIAEVSFPSTGLGIELGWANLYNTPIVCIYKEGTKPSVAVYAVTDKTIGYSDFKDLIDKITDLITSNK